MSIPIKVEYHYGARSSRQILFENNLYGFSRDSIRKCTNKKCNSKIKVNNWTHEITDTSKAIHLGH